MSSKKGSSSKHSQRAEPPQQQQQQRISTYFVDGAGIDREVITADICRYLGNDALVRPGLYTGGGSGQPIQGFFITGYRALTSRQLDSLRADSARWAAERSEKSQSMPSSSRGQSTSSEVYTQSATAAARARGGYPQEMGPPSVSEPDYGDSRPSYMSSMAPPTQSPSYEQQPRYQVPTPSVSYSQQDYTAYNNYDNPATVAYEVLPQQQPRTGFPGSGVSYAPEPRAQGYSSTTGYYTQVPAFSGRQLQQQPQQQQPQPQQQPQQTSQPMQPIDYSQPLQLPQGQPQQAYHQARAPPTYDHEDDDMEYEEPEPAPAPPSSHQSHSSSRQRDRESSDRDPGHRRKDRR